MRPNHGLVGDVSTATHSSSAKLDLRSGVAPATGLCHVTPSSYELETVACSPPNSGDRSASDAEQMTVPHAKETAAPAAAGAASAATAATAARDLNLIRSSPLRCGEPNRRTSIGRVLRLDLLAAELGDRIVRSDCGLAHPDRDERDLALVAGDVPGGVDAGHRCPARHRVDRKLPLAVQLDVPFGDCAEMRDKAEQRDQSVAVDALEGLVVGLLDRHRLDPSVAVDLSHLDQ